MRRKIGLFLVIGCIVLCFSPVVSAETGADNVLTYPREDAVVRAVKIVSPAVVNISTQYEVRTRVNPFANFGGGDFFNNFFNQGIEGREKLTSLGSGVIIDGKRGFILTNAHVVVKGAKITVVLKDGRQLDAEIVGIDPESDLAVLKIPAESPLPAIAMGNSADLMIGETVIAIGNPFGFSNTVTVGVVSAINRSFQIRNRVYRDLIQTDASINPGNSGGPLLNIDGQLIGINTAIYKNAEGIGFAIPINRARKIISDLIKYGEVVPGWIGLSVQNIDSRLAAYLNLPKDTGVVVRSVDASSPAKAAGIREGDIVLSIDGQKIQSTDDYKTAMRGYRKGQHAAVDINRNGKDMTLSVNIEVFPESLAPELAYRLLGVKVVGISEKNRFHQPISADKGVIISTIDPQSSLAGIGARPGDVIRKIDAEPTNDVHSFYKTMIKDRWKQSIVILLQRGNQGYYITLQLS